MIERPHTSIRAPHIVLLLINLALVIGFGIVFGIRQNYEFLTYVVVVAGVGGVVVASMRRVDFTLDTLVAMTVWAAMHLAGGGILLEGPGCLYASMIYQLPTELPIFRYDQLIHIWGFATAALLTRDMLAGHLRSPLPGKVAVSIVIVMAACGFGALNEIIEFLVDATVPDSGVGGYVNTSLDMCSNLVGGLLGMIYLHLRGRLK
jgi:uncharacterized membrane protein YjdF